MHLMTQNNTSNNWPAQNASAKNRSRQGKMTRAAQGATQKQPSVSGAFTSSGSTTTSSSFNVDGTYSSPREEGVWLVDAVAIAIGNISRPRGEAVRAISHLLMERSAVPARSATALASEFAGVETEETCHAIAVLCSDGWQGSFAELLNAARNVCLGWDWSALGSAASCVLEPLCRAGAVTGATTPGQLAAVASRTQTVRQGRENVLPVYRDELPAGVEQENCGDHQPEQDHRAPFGGDGALQVFETWKSTIHTVPGTGTGCSADEPASFAIVAAERPACIQHLRDSEFRNRATGQH